MDKQALQAQMRNDPRVQQLVQGRPGGVVTGAELRKLGYDVPESWQYRPLTPRAGANSPYGLVDNSINGMEWLPVAGGATLLGLGAAGAAGVGPLAGGSAGASGAAASADTMMGTGGFDGPIGQPVGAAGGAGGGRGLSDYAKSLLGIKDYAALGLGGLSALNGMRQPSANDDLKRMLGLAEDRVTSSKPLFDALQTMAMSGLPSYAKGNQ